MLTNPETKQQILRYFQTYREITTTKKITNNTVRIDFKDGGYIIRYHHTNVIDVRSNGDVVISSGGWNTNSTRDRLNQYFPKIAIKDFSVSFSLYKGRIHYTITPTHSHTLPTKTVELCGETCFNQKHILKIILSPNTV